MPAPRNVPSRVSPQTFSVQETATLLGISKQSVYRAISVGQLNATRIGSRIVIRREVVAAILGAPIAEASSHAA